VHAAALGDPPEAASVDALRRKTKLRQRLAEMRDVLDRRACIRKIDGQWRVSPLDLAYFEAKRRVQTARHGSRSFRFPFQKRLQEAV
jgi:hypothetical protein